MAALSLLVSACGAVSGSGPDGTDPSADGPRSITDVMDRTVEVPATVDRVLVDGAFATYTMALLNPEDPLGPIVGMPNDFEQNDPDALAHYAEDFPEIKDIPRVGQIWDGSFSVEAAIKLEPQVFLMGASSWDSAEDAGIVDGLAKAGIPTLVFDYFVDPVKNTVPAWR